MMKSLILSLAGGLLTVLIVWFLTHDLNVALILGGIETGVHFALINLSARIRGHIQDGGSPSMVIWLTGLSGAGKSTVAQGLAQALRNKKQKVEELDGDALRQIFPQTGFSKEERDLHVKRVGHLASRLERQGVIVIASLISPYRESRDFVRKQCQNFLEVHVSTPLSVCEQRDPKGLYKKVKAGEIKNFTGVDDPYEAPVQPELVLDTSQTSLDESVDLILRRMQEMKVANDATP